MKKIYNKINKQQWRITVPNINSNLFRRSPSKEDESKSSDKESKRSSGFYDLQEAQLEYDKTRSLPNSVYVNSDTDSDSSDDHYEDAREKSAKNSTGEITKDLSGNETDTDLYVDVEADIKSKNIDQNNSKFEYDVPRISFKFFEKPSPNNDEQIEQNHYENETPEYEPVLVKHTVKSEVTIVLATPEPEETVPSEKMDAPGQEEAVSLPKSHPSEKFVSHTEIVVQRSLEEIMPVGLRKSGSDPNIVLRERNNIDDDDEDGDGFYKVPRSLKKAHRLSQSLHDFDVENMQGLTSSHSSIEHISCSQVLSQYPAGNEPNSCGDGGSGPNSENMDYCKVRSKLPIKLRRPTLLRKPKKAVDSWNNFRTKFSKAISDQAAQQRVGAFSEKEKVTINLEEMYKNSKTKCKKVLQNTGKIFVRSKKSVDSDVDSNINNSSCNNSPTIKKNDAFFVPPAPPRHLKASDIEYQLNTSDGGDLKDCDTSENINDSVSRLNDSSILSSPLSVCDEKREEFDFSTITSAFRKKLFMPEGQNGFEDLRRYVKQGGDFCKELSAILQERAEAECQYAKSLSKLSAKLSRACRDGVGGLNEAWKAVALELESRAEGHRIIGAALLEETAKPLKNITEAQHRTRKHCETAVEKAARSLADWRAAEAKSKKHSHACARDNEKLQDAAIIDTSKFGKQTLSKSTSLIQLAHRQNSSDKENAKLEGKKRKAEDAVKKADIEYYTLCVRAERARLEWESAVLCGVNAFQSLEEERLSNLKIVLMSYLKHSSELGPRLIEATDQIRAPVAISEPTKDLTAFHNLRQSSQQISEQLLPDFYCEHITLAMNRERRKQALVKLLHLIRQDIERERKSKNGLENLSKAIKQTPNFGTEDSQHSVTEKLYHMKSMLTYLEGARYKVQSALAELDSRPRGGHPLAPHIIITRDKSGLQQSILKVPQWLREEFFETDKSPVSEKSLKSDKSDNSDPHNNDVDDPEWPHRGAADGNSNQPDSDFDEFSSQCSSTDGKLCNTEESHVQPLGKCRAIYPYTPNLTDELPLRPGDILSIYRQQDDGWWLGECNGNVGIFPATYVEMMPS